MLTDLLGRQGASGGHVLTRPASDVGRAGGDGTDGVVLAHDYATQRGGAERVALQLAAAFPGAPLYTTLYDPAGTFGEFAELDVRTTALDRVGVLRRNHRLALPALAPAVSSTRVEADVLVASSSGWAHAFRGARRTVVYCHAPARWLYQRSRYLGAGGGVADHARRWAAGATLAALAPALRSWDARAARRADVYLANSTVTRRAVELAYGITAEVVPPPPALLPSGEERAPQGAEPGHWLCVARLLPYKNVDAVIAALRELPSERLVVVGEGPDRHRLEALAQRWGVASRVALLGRVEDEELRWLYRHARLLVAASYEDYGLTPLEAAAFGVPAVVLRDGGYLDTVRDGVTGEFFAAPRGDEIAAAVEAAGRREWDPAAISRHVENFAPERFTARLRGVVKELRTAG